MNQANYNPKILSRMVQAVNETIEQCGSQQKAADHIGVTSGQVSFLKKGEFQNIGDETFRKVKAKLMVSDWGNYPTKNFAMAVTVAAAAKEDMRMVGLIGFTGAGKTHALTAYAKKDADTYYILADTEMTKYAFLKELCKSVGVRNVNDYSKTEMINAVVRKLTQGGKPLLIVDDVGKLSDANIRIIQIIYDRTEFQCGILLAGMPNLKVGIDRKASKDVKGFQELKRRIAYWEELKAISESDIQLICADNGITDQSAMLYLRRECADFGTLRNMVGNVLKLSAKLGEEVKAELLTKMNKGRQR